MFKKAKDFDDRKRIFRQLILQYHPDKLNFEISHDDKIVAERIYAYLDKHQVIFRFYFSLGSAFEGTGCRN